MIERNILADGTILADRRLVSWGSIIAGTVTVLAVSLLLSLLNSGLGLGMVDAQSNDPLGGVGITFGIGSAIALLISLAAGGFVAGHLAGQAGWVHGFLTWATTLLAAALLSAMAIGGAANLAGSAIGGIMGATGSVAGAAGSLVSTAAGGISQQIQGGLLEDLDITDASSNIRTALGNTQIDALQPENIEAQLSGAREDLQAAATKLATNPGDIGTIAEELIASLQERVAAISTDIDRDEVVTALQANGNMTQPQAEQAADNAIAAYEGVVQQASTQLDNAEKAINGASAQFAQLQEEARVQADRVAAAASQASLWAFFAALVGAVICAGASIVGSRTQRFDRY